MKILKEILIVVACLCVIFNTIVSVFVIYNVYANMSKLCSVSQSVDKALQVVGNAGPVIDKLIKK